MPVVGCYTMDLYCDGPCKKSDVCGRTIVAQFTGYDEATCKQVAKKSGWKFTRDEVYCSACIELFKLQMKAMGEVTKEMLS